MSALLFTQPQFRDITLRNRIVVSPMCMYSSEDGFSNEWHFVHLGAFAVGGSGLVFTEATAVEPRGRISPQDLGIYKDEHVEHLSKITRFIKEHGAAPGIQLAHAGRKASTRRPWDGRGTIAPDDGGWIPVGPSPVPFSDAYPTPAELTRDDIQTIVQSFAKAAERSLAAGFELVEIHAAHGYLIHEFLSPLSNLRADAYGGSLQNRSRFAREVIESIRKVWPERLPLFIRISATDWAEGGWDIEEAVEFCRIIKPLGIDLVDCSTGGNIWSATMEVGPGYQVPFAEQIKREAHIPTGAVGLITSPEQSEHILRTGQADLVVLARELLRDPFWPRRAAAALKAEIQPPKQYERAW